MPQTVYRQVGVIEVDGKVQVTVPVAPGTAVEILVITPETTEFDDLIAAAESSTEFWNNPMDDEDWNDAKPR